MKTKKIKYTENMSVVFDKETKNKIIELAIQNNQSQGEFVRDAVEFYLNNAFSTEKVLVDINTMKDINKVLDHLWYNKILNDNNNEIANIVFVLVTEKLNNIQ